MLKCIDNMFGWAFKQPLHKSLRQMRLLQVVLIINSQALLWYIAQRLSELDPVAAVGAYSAIAISLVAAIWKAVDSLSYPIKEDEDK